MCTSDRRRRPEDGERALCAAVIITHPAGVPVRLVLQVAREDVPLRDPLVLGGWLAIRWVGRLLATTIHTSIAQARTLVSPHANTDKSTQILHI